MFRFDYSIHFLRWALKPPEFLRRALQICTVLGGRVGPELVLLAGVGIWGFECKVEERCLSCWRLPRSPCFGGYILGLIFFVALMVFLLSFLAACLLCFFVASLASVAFAGFRQAWLLWLSASSGFSL